MTFRSIGTLAGDVLRKAELAAAAHNAQRNEGGAAMPGGATATPPVTLYGRGGPERDGNERDGARSPASYTGGHVKQGRNYALAIPPTIGRGTITAPHELPRSAVVVSLAMVRAQRHAAPRSITL
jgi:hypothetical protein